MLFAAKGAWDALQPVMWLAGALMAAAIVLMVIQRWKKSREIAEDRASDELTEYRELYEEGEISEAEYKRLHALLAGKLKLKEKAQPAPLPPPEKSAQPEQSNVEGENPKPNQNPKEE